MACAAAAAAAAAARHLRRPTRLSATLFGGTAPRLAGAGLGGAGAAGMRSGGSGRDYGGSGVSAAAVPAAVATPGATEPTFVHHKALLLDVAGTLLTPSEAVTEVYRRYGKKYGVTAGDAEMLARFRLAYSQPWGESVLRYVGDGRPFWRHVVAETTGCADPGLFEEVYAYYARPEAWRVAPGAEGNLRLLRALGIKLAIVSNFDSRLRPLLDGMRLTPLFDAVMVSAEVGAEKPNPVIFDAAVEALALEPAQCLHVGDDRRNDLWGARDAGCHALLWGSDVKDMSEVVQVVLRGDVADPDDGSSAACSQ